MINNQKGVFITLEGIEGTGKSTHVTFIRDQLQKTGRKVVITREPGGTPAGEAIRELLLDNKSLSIKPETELLLMFAARQQHISQVIRPALDSGKTVLCDRFTDSSYAYQGGGRGIASDKICQLVTWVQADLKPDLTLLFDIEIETGLSRAKSKGDADRFEAETLDFFQNVRNAYLKIAEVEPQRFKLIDASVSIDKVQESIITVLKEQGIC